MARRHKNDKIKLYNANPFCNWCGTKMMFYGRIESGNPIPDDAVTVDHLYPNGDERRRWYKQHHIPSPVVLCCNKCNNERNNRSPEDQEIVTGRSREGWKILYFYSKKEESLIYG